MASTAKFVDVRLIVIEDEEGGSKLKTAYVIKTDIEDTESLAENWAQSDNFQTTIAEIIVSAVGE